jgi:pullulanase/glycogen debranching enzyme
VPGDERYYMDFTGTGNSLNMMHPRTIQLIMDSLRYWVTEMHVDGFRFDLAPVLARELYEVNRLSAFFDIIHQDPVLSRVKLIAEPWDVGPGGYQAGNFPVGGRSGTASTATASAASGAATRAWCPSSRRGCRGRATSTRGATAARTRASTSSPRTTATRCATS